MENFSCAYGLEADIILLTQTHFNLFIAGSKRKWLKKLSLWLI